jgi:hypothetical protein
MHTQIYEKEVQEFEVLAEIGVLLKLKLKDKKPPCTLQISVVDDNKNYFFCYVSDEVRHPNENANTNKMSFNTAGKDFHRLVFTG